MAGNSFRLSESASNRIKTAVQMEAGCNAMNPLLAWRGLHAAWHGRNWQRVVENSEWLLDWLDRGGLPPRLLLPKNFGIEFDAIVVREACLSAYQRASRALRDPVSVAQSVPFLLTCRLCDSLGPFSHEEAISAGWQRIEYVPTSLAENFLGNCPICEADIAE